MTNQTKQVFFSEGDYGYRATPGNQVVDVANGDADAIVFHNMTGQEVLLFLPLETRAQRRQQQPVGGEVVQIKSPGRYPLDLSKYPPGQYYYTARVADGQLDVAGGSSPGIIITR